MLGLEELAPSVRRNLLFESGYSVAAGVVNGLALLSQVAVLGESLRGDRFTAAIITAALPASMILQPLWAAAARRYRLQRMALLSGALRSLPLFAMGWVGHAWVFALLVVVYYFMAAPLSLAVSSLYKYNYPDSHRGRLMGILRMIQNSVAMPVMLGCAWLLDLEHDSYQLIYPIGGAVGLAGLFFYAALRIPGDSPGDRARLSEPPTLRQIRDVLATDTNFRLFQMTIWLTGAGFLMTRPMWFYLLKTQFGLSQLELSFLGQAMPVILGALTSPAWGALMDKTSPVAGRIAFAWLGIFAYAAIFASFLTGWLWLAYAGAILRGLVLGAAELATTAGNLYFSLKPERAALYESISSLFQGVRGLTIPLIGSLLFSVLNIYLFLLPAAMNFWSLRLALRLWRRDQRTMLAGEEIE